MLFLFDTLTHQKKLFKEHKKGEIKLYVCGITPYDFAHIGHGRCYVFFDFVYRFFSMRGYQVTYCRNFTDIDDKLLNKSLKIYGTKDKYLEIADGCIKQFEHDMKALDCKKPTVEPRVTENIPEIINFISDLINKGFAYEVNGDVYFRVEKFHDYGKLSKQNKDALLAGTRHEVRHEKENPLDFALWKKEIDNIFWQSPRGIGRPGWHIECSALSKKYLGDFVDIHGGGLDLIFPHHENEIAQSESLLDHQFVNYWLHVGLVMSNEEKMSKSLGNFVILKDILQKYNPMELRFYYLSHHYRSPLPFSYSMLDAYKKSYHKLCLLFDDAKINEKDLFIADHAVIKKIMESLEDDFNTTAMFGAIFEDIAIIRKNTELKKSVKSILQQICGLKLEIIQEKTAITPQIQKLLEDREIARKEKNWTQADKIRDQLVSLGVEVQDKKS